MDDLAWLAQHVGTFAAGGDIADAAAGCVVEPTRIAAARSHGHVIAVVGWPTGRHHTLIKAAEARLAGEMGADEVWVMASPDGDTNATLAELIAVRQAVAPPLRLGAVVPPGHEEAAAKAGVDVLAYEYGTPPPTTRIEVAAYGEVPDINATIAALEAGATRVFATDPKAAVQESSHPAR